MCPGLTNDLQQVEDSRKTAIINRELERLNIDIAALQETRLPSSGSLREQDYTFFWQGREPEELHMHGSMTLAYTLPYSALRLRPRMSFMRSLRLPSERSQPQNNYTCLGISMLVSELTKNPGPPIIGHFGVGKLNENGQRLLEMCSYHDLCVTNTFFATKPQHKVSWCHPRSRHWHQLDLVITRRPSLNCVLTTRSYHSADCDTDHSLVGCKVRLQPKRIDHSKQKGRPRINTVRAKMPDLCKRFAYSTEEAHRDCPTNSAEERWNHIRGPIYNSAMDTFGKRQRQNPDWFEAGITKPEPAIAPKRKALLNYKREPSEKTLDALRKARNDAQRLPRRSANDYWLNLCQNIQVSPDCGNIRDMCDGMKKAFGPSITKIAPLKTASGDTITDRGKQMERWVEHYQERENTVSTAAVDELRKAIDSLASGKALGNDGITPEVVKAGKSTALHHHPHELLLHTVGKAFARVVLNRLQKLAERVYPEAHCGFRSERSTTDMVFSLRQLQEKCREQRCPLYIAFIDLTKAFDLVSREGLFTLLQRIGCPPKLLRMISSFHEDMHVTVQYDGSYSDPFPNRSGVKQGCVLAPTLFGIFFSLLLSCAFSQSEDGVYLHIRNDGSLFNLARLRV
ncbi:uncharacterized protein LOC143018741 [Oratosquilla oratoria]|uniref:uncharacterized protein LOC143018741 n=1 Tax=Oratosquilla oratoria TaxID=337810 RepID=UPI003F77170B